MDKKKLLISVALVVTIAAFFLLGLQRYFTLDYLKAQHAAINQYYAANPLTTAAIYFAIYIAVTALSLPGAAIMTLAAGAVFGLIWGTVIVSFASAIGATLAFLASRYIFGASIQARFGDKLSAVNSGIAREGAFYLFALRLIPAFPFFVVNLVMALTPINTITFYWVSQLGMLPGTILFVYAGTEIAKLDSLHDILSPSLLIAFTVLSVFPLIARWCVDAVKARKVYAKWTRPPHFDCNLLVIGAGSAGLVAAYIAATVKAKVVLIEKHKMGGDCLNTGCVPSKALIRSARFLSHARRAQEFGIQSAEVRFDFAVVMERVQRIIRAIEPHDSIERYTRLGVNCISGEAKLTSPWTVDVTTATGKQTVTTKNIVIAAGARPIIPAIPGLREINPLTFETVWSLRTLPKRLLVLGGGPIGCELAQAFARFGSRVTQVEKLPRILCREDAEFSQMVAARFTAEGITLLAGHEARRIETVDGDKCLIVENNGVETAIAFDELLCAVGRIANTAHYGLEELGIPVSANHTVDVNEYLRTLYPNIYACGDVAGPFQFTHTAAHTAWYAAINALFGRFRNFKVDYAVIPWTTFTEPEVARVGLNEQEAKEKDIAYTATVFPLNELDRAIVDGEAHGLIKVLTAPRSDRILGVTVAGEHAGDVLAEFVIAMRHGLGLNKILGTIHSYPTLAEANKYVAGAWKRSQVTQGQLDFAAAFHAWQRDEGTVSQVLAKLPGLMTNKTRLEAQDFATH